MVLQRVRESYSRLASDYVEFTWDFARYPGLRGEILKFFESAPSGRVLDLGSGSGRDSSLAVAVGRQAVLADSSLELLRRSRGPRTLVCCDAISLPFRTCTFSAVIASGVYLHLPQQLCKRALEELRRVMTVGGLTMISMKAGVGQGWRVNGDFSEPRWFSYYDPGEFAELCGISGLSVQSVEVAPRKDWFAVTAVAS